MRKVLAAGLGSLLLLIPASVVSRPVSPVVNRQAVCAGRPAARTVTLAFADGNKGKAGSGTVTSLFPADAWKFERYAAVLAATDPLRKKRDDRAKATLKPFEYFLLKQKGRLGGGKGICDVEAVDPRGKNLELRAVCADHVDTMSAVIKAMGMTVKEFNALSRTVAKCPDLRDRVMKQAYYYRIAAELSASALRDQVEERASPGGSGYARGVLGSGDAKVFGSAMGGVQATLRPVAAKPQPKKPPLTKAQFLKASRSVERLRLKLENELKQELSIDALPEGICSPAFLPMLQPKVKLLCVSFPARAQAVVEAQGVDAEAFNHMVRRAGKNPILRWQLARTLRRNGLAK